MKPDVMAYSIKAAAEQIGCGLTFIYREIGAGRIEARKMGDRTLILAKDLKAYVESLPKAKITTGQNG